MSEETRIVILAAGKGKRMNGDLPKVLEPLGGKPMIERLLESVERSGIDKDPVIVVGYKKDLVLEKLGSSYKYVVQEEQLGTGHAVLSTYVPCFKESGPGNILVLYGDHPFVSAETIIKLRDRHLESKAKITMATIRLPDFEDWRSFFYNNFSRIIRNHSGEIIRSVEVKEMTDLERDIKEINPCYFCFDAQWLWSHLSLLKNTNSQKEYYLTDLIKMATGEKEKIESIEIPIREGLGANSKEELEILEKFKV